MSYETIEVKPDGEIEARTYGCSCCSYTNYLDRDLAVLECSVTAEVYERKAKTYRQLEQALRKWAPRTIGIAIDKFQHDETDLTSTEETILAFLGYKLFL